MSADAVIGVVVADDVVQNFGRLLQSQIRANIQHVIGRPSMAASLDGSSRAARFVGWDRIPFGSRTATTKNSFIRRQANGLCFEEGLLDSIDCRNETSVTHGGFPRDDLKRVRQNRRG